MNLYHLLYESPAQRPARHEPRTAAGRFLQVVWREGLTLMQLNLLFLCACLPVLTIGPALGALAAVTGKLVRDEPVLLWRDYWGAFRRTFRPCFWSGLILGGCGAGLGAAATAAILFLPESAWQYALVCGACALWLILCGAAVYLFPLQGEGKGAAWRRAWLLSLRFPQRALPCALGVIAALLAGILLAPYSVPVVLLFLCAGAALAVRCVLEKDLQRAEKAKFPSFD